MRGDPHDNCRILKRGWRGKAESMYAGSLPASNTWTATWFMKHSYPASYDMFSTFQVGSQTTQSGAIWVNDVCFGGVSYSHLYQASWTGIMLRATEPYQSSYGSAFTTQSPEWLTQNVWHFCWLKGRPRLSCPRCIACRPKHF